MLWDGLPLAIRNLRTRRGLLQGQAAKRGGTSADKWSQWETRTKRLLRTDLEIVMEGLGVTEVELYQEAARLEHQHYAQLAAETGEPIPICDTSVTSNVIGGLPQDKGDLPPDTRQWQNKLSNVSAAVVAIAMSLADCVKDGHPILVQDFQDLLAAVDEEVIPGDEPEDGD